MKTGILGGTFNPPHIGHLILAEDALRLLGLDRLFFIPTNVSPHKGNDTAKAFHRFNMVKLAISGNDKLEALDIEIKKEGVSYTIDTLRQLKKDYPSDSFYLIIGSDLANDFSRWKSPEDIKKEATIAVANRIDSPLKNKDDFKVIEITQMQISSSRIRNMLENKFSIRYLVRDEVRDYIAKHNLYR